MSESFLSVCPNCQAKLKLKNPDLIGKKAKCPKCAEPFIVKPARIKSPQAVATTTAAASPPAAKPASKPVAAEDDWMNDDLGSFDSGEDWPPASPASGPAPPMVTGSPANRKSTPGKKTRKKRQNPYEEPNTLVSCLLAFLAGSFAAVVGAGIWLAIIIFTGYEVGLIAWAIGGLVGFATLLGSRDHIVGDLSGYIAAAIALMAVTVPKLLILAVLSLAGEAIAFGDLFSPFDALWIFLAVGTAYRVGSGQSGEED